MQQELPVRDFAELSPPDRIQLCREMADDAMEHAKRATPNLRAAFTVIAIQWLVLADDIARETIGLF
jgi:hypothetical protein